MSRWRAAASRAQASLRAPTATTTITNLGILAGNAVAGVVSARALGPAGRGQLAIVVLWSALISMVGSVGLLSSCSYYVARWPNRRAALAGWLRRIAAWQAIAMTAVSIAILWVLQLRLNLPPLLTIEYTTWAAATVITLYGTCYAQGSGDFIRFNVIRIISGGTPAVLMLAGAVTVRLTPAEAGAAYLVPTWYTAGLACIWLRRASYGAPTRRLSPRERRSMWSYGWRSLASFSGLALNRSSDQFVLGLLVPLVSLGLYSAAASASAPLPSLIASFGMVGLPTVAALAGREKTVATWSTLRRAACLMAVTSPALAVLLPWAIPFVYGARYSTAVAPAELLLPGAVFTALAAVADDLLRAHGHPGFVSITQGAGGVVTIIGTVLLARRSITAVALISSIGFMVAFVLALIRLWIATSRRSGNDGEVEQRDTAPTSRHDHVQQGQTVVVVDLRPSPEPTVELAGHDSLMPGRRKFSRLAWRINRGLSRKRRSRICRRGQPPLISRNRDT